MKTTYYLEEPSRHNFLSTLHAKNDTTNLSGYKLDKSTENNKFLLFFSGKETIQTFNGSIKAITLFPGGNLIKILPRFLLRFLPRS